jgi:hypothetical protein
MGLSKFSFLFFYLIKVLLFYLIKVFLIINNRLLFFFFFINLLFSFTSFLVYYSLTVIEFLCLLLICLVAQKTISLEINISL